MAVSQPPDTTSRIMVSTSRMTKKLEIAYCMCLSFWTLGIRPNVAERLWRRWYNLSFGLERFLALFRSLHLIVIFSVDVFQRLGLSVVTSSGQKRAVWWSWGIRTRRWWQEDEWTSPRTWEGKWRRLSEWVRKWRCKNMSETENPKGWVDYSLDSYHKSFTGCSYCS